MAEKRRLLGRLALLLAFAGLGAYIVRGSQSVPALTWMRIYDPVDFVHASLSDIIRFFMALLIPIPPIIGLAEIVSTKVAGSTILVTQYAYRIALVGTYVAAIALAGTSAKRMLAAFLVSMLFLYVTTKVHATNPQNYDIFFPMFFLAYLLLLKKSSIQHRYVHGKTWIAPAAAGFFLSMTELSRPFVIYVLPLLLACSYFALAAVGLKRSFVALILPVLLISGSWHSYLLVAHRHFTFSNNSGFNLLRAWPQIPTGPLIEESGAAPLAPGRWENLNTAEHAENSRRLEQVVFVYWLQHPLDSLLFSVGRINALLAGDTAFYDHEPASRWFGLYRLLVRATSSLILLGAAVLLAQGCGQPLRVSSILSKLDNIVLLFTVSCIVFLAVGEAGEEPRLLLSLLPFFAMLPIYRPPSRPPTGDRQQTDDPIW